MPRLEHDVFIGNWRINAEAYHRFALADRLASGAETEGAKAHYDAVMERIYSTFSDIAIDI
jgi:hypothetical protein